MGAGRGGRELTLLFVPVLCLILGWAGAAAQVRSGTEFELLSGVGYQSNGSGPSVLLGVQISAYSRQGSFFAGLQENRVGLHFSDVVTGDAAPNTLTVGADASWTRTQGPFSFSLGGQAFLRQKGEAIARTAGIAGTGVTGRIVARFRADYVEGSLGTFPWFQQDLEGLSQSAGDAPFYRVQASVAASILPAYGLNWSQEARWRGPAGGGDGVLSVTTGPQLNVGGGTFGIQGGILFDGLGVQPVWQLRYELRPLASNVDLQVTAATRSLDGDGPVLYGWLGIEGERLGFGAAVHFERTEAGNLSPAVYISVLPKF